MGSSAAEVDLIQAARCGSLQAREALYRRHIQTMHRLAFRLCGRFADPAPITRNCFQQAFASLDQVTGSETLVPWLAGLIVKASHRAIWRAQLVARFHLGTPVQNPAFDEVIEASIPAQGARDYGRLYDALERLPLRWRTAFLLHHLENMPVTDVALAMTTTKTAARRWISRAESRLGVGAVLPTMLAAQSDSAGITLWGR